MNEMNCSTCENIGDFQDNVGTIYVAEDPLSSSKSKHIDPRFHLLREPSTSGDTPVKGL